MAATLQYPYRLSLTERAGGWVLAVCLHVMLFSLLVIVKPRSTGEVPLEPQPIQIRFQEDLPPEPAVQPAGDIAAVMPIQPAAPLDAQPAGNTGADSGKDDRETSVEPGGNGEKTGEGKGENKSASDIEKFLNKNYLAESKPAALETKPATVAAVASPEAASSGGPEATTTDSNAPQAGDGKDGDYAQLIATMRARADELSRQNELARMEGSKAVAGKLMSTHAKVAADKTLFSADPLHSGVIRSVETTGVPNNAADEVLKRWGFNVKIMQVAGGVKGGDYLSGIETSAGKFVNATSQPGFYRVLILSDVTVRRLVELETEAMKKKGYDPGKVTLKRVVFGVVPAGKTFDLAVTKLEVEPIKAATPAPAGTLEATVKRVK